MLFPILARQASLSMGFSRQEYWSGLPCPPPRDLLNQGIKPRSPALQADSLPSEPAAKSLQWCPTLCDPMDCSPPGLCPWNSPGQHTGVGCHALLQGIFPTQGSNLQNLVNSLRLPVAGQASLSVGVCGYQRAGLGQEGPDPFV